MYDESRSDLGFTAGLAAFLDRMIGRVLLVIPLGLAWFAGPVSAVAGLMFEEKVDALLEFVVLGAFLLIPISWLMLLIGRRRSRVLTAVQVLVFFGTALILTFFVALVMQEALYVGVVHVYGLGTTTSYTFGLFLVMFKLMLSAVLLAVIVLRYVVGREWVLTVIDTVYFRLGIFGLAAVLLISPTVTFVISSFNGVSGKVSGCGHFRFETSLWLDRERKLPVMHIYQGGGPETRFAVAERLVSCSTLDAMTTDAVAIKLGYPDDRYGAPEESNDRKQYWSYVISEEKGFLSAERPTLDIVFSSKGSVINASIDYGGN